MANGLHGKNLAHSEILCTWRSSLRGTWEVLIHARTRVPGRLGKATSRTPSMYVDEKSDGAIVPPKRPVRAQFGHTAPTLQGEATPGGSRGGKGLTQGEQPLGGRGSDTEPKYRVDLNNGCASGDERD